MCDCTSTPRTLAAVILMAAVLMAGHAAGHYPNIPLAEVADVVIVIKPRERYSLHRPATVDRIVQGDLVRIEKGVAPLVILHTRNSFSSPLEAGVPVKLYLKAFKDGHAHYIIGVWPNPSESRP